MNRLITIIFATLGIIFVSPFLATSYGQQPSMIPDIRITSPSENQTIPIGNLKVYGTSNDNNRFNCEVSIVLNDVRPYQPVTPAGEGGKGDFSKWNYEFTPYYAQIKGGPNEIGAKIFCPELAATVNNTSFYTVNVTGH